jgi:hypothetical protein
VVSHDGQATRRAMSTLAAETNRLARTRDAVTRGARFVEALPAPRVVAAFIAVEWLAILATGLVVRHAGWIYYQGGDQLWYYTLGWALGHGHLTQTPVGYGWSFLLAPIALVAGPNLVSAFPAIVLLNVLVLMPAAMLALYGIAVRIGGRLFGYWALLLWVVVPFIGIRYTNTGYHQKYTELLLPQAFGLSAMADFPTTVATLVSVYFCMRTLTSEHPELLDGLACGAAAGIAIAIKPSTSIFLAGIAVALALRRRAAIAGCVFAGMVPALAALALWKERGLGHVPLLSSSAPAPHGLAAAQPVAGLNLHKYTHQVDWSRFLNNLDLIREHFWSNRLIEWLVIAGLIGLARRSRTAALLVGVWFAAFAVIKGGYAQASVEDGSFFRVMMPSYPAFLLLLASVPLLLPHAPKALRDYTQTFRRPAARTRWALLGATILVSGAVPLAAFAAASRGSGLDATTVGSTIMPIPGNIDIGLSAKVTGKAVVLSWRKQDPFGGPVFFRVWRDHKDAFTCSTSADPGGRICNVSLPEVGTTHADQFIDHPGPGHWVYRVAIAANWLNDAGYGDPYLVSSPVTVTRR